MLCKEHYRIYSKEYDSIDTKDMPRLLSSYSLAPDVIDIERYYTSSHHKDQDIIDSIQQDTSLPKGSYYLDIKDIEESLKIRTDYLYTRASGYKALNIYTIDTPNNQYKISYFNNPLDNIPYPKGTTFLTTPNTPIPTHYTDERVKIFLKGSNTYKNFILNLKQKIDSIQSQYEIERVRLEVGYEKQYSLAHSPLAELIVSKESKNDYNIANKYNPKTKNYPPTKEYTLTKMTLKEVMDKQDKKELFATGRYQIVPNTLKEAKAKLKLNENDLYNEEMQDRIFEEYLLDKKAGRSAISDYIKRNGDIEKAAYALAQEFASIGVKEGKAIAEHPKGTKRISNGKQSYYEDIGGNKMLITYERIIQALKDTKEQGGY